MEKIILSKVYNSLAVKLRNYIVRHIARVEGFLDPLLVLANLKKFAQPSELLAPKELLRAGAVMQARGLINSQAIQHNMDWVWPYWVERQFDPADESFIPRAFNLTHLNLTHRNWTAVGVPDYTDLSIIDPRGLVTPFFDGWSIDTWIINEEGARLIPSRLVTVKQEWQLQENPQVITTAGENGMNLRSCVESYEQAGTVICQIVLTGLSKSAGWLAVSLRPCNPEGISFIHKISLLEKCMGWKVDGNTPVYFNVKSEKNYFSQYWDGDVFGLVTDQLLLPSLNDSGGNQSVECNVGMATAAALFKLEPGVKREVIVSIPLSKNIDLKPSGDLKSAVFKWNENLNGICRANLPDKHFQFLYDSSIRALILHSPNEEVYPGPYTYKRFWFRDAAFILDALLRAGFSERVKKIIDYFPKRQTFDGYFLSQDGEWDSNGEALWVMRRFCEMTGVNPELKWKTSIYRAAKWIQNKREFKTGSKSFGLLPVGFSAEHLGPNDYYYWDDFWGAAGLEAAAFMAEKFGDRDLSRQFSAQAHDLMRCIEISLKMAGEKTKRSGMPASSHRRMDAGAIGSIAAGYPLQLFEANDPRLLDTAEFLFKECFIQGGFYQEISHSGINVYLTLHVAQVFLRAGDPRFFDLMTSTASLVSPTGQWPEAIHPRTRGGCMGDGQHIWAAAEWVLMITNCFIREDEGKLILCSGIPGSWLIESKEVSLGPALTKFGPVKVQLNVENGKIKIQWFGDWLKGQEPPIEIRLPNFPAIKVKAGENWFVVAK